MGIFTRLYSYTLLVLTLVAFLSLGIVVVGNAFLSPLGFHFAYSQGFSMCKAENPSLDYLYLGNAQCAYAPGDILITYEKWPPELNKIGCGYLDGVGVVCHRVSKVEENKVCFVGDHPRAYPEFCVSRDKYYGEVIAKLPRFIGMPGLALAEIVSGVSDFLQQINSGKYPSL